MYMMTEPTSRKTLLFAFGQAVRNRRIALGLSQEKLAELAGLHRTYICDIERGTRNVALVNIAHIATSLQYSPSELLQAAQDIINGGINK